MKMSEIIVAILLIVPVALAVVLLNKANKRQKKEAHNKLSAYVSQITHQLQFKQSFWRRLLYQLVLIDDEAREMVIVNHKGHLSHKLFSLDMIENIKVISLKQTVSFADTGKKASVVTTQIGVEIIFTKPRQEIFLVVYDHIAHNIFQMADLENEARQLHDDINKFRTSKLISA